MMDFWHIFWVVPLCIFAGSFFAKKEKEEEPKKSEEKPFEEEKERDPLSLRNGYSVTRNKNPTFAEQWVNIMNYSGESQMEEDYE